MSNNQRWMNGNPAFVDVPVATATAVEIGDIIRIASNLGVVVTGATHNLTLYGVAMQAHVANSGAALIRCIKVDPNNVFEFPLDTATSVAFGDELQISGAQELKKSSTDPVANVIKTETSATVVRCTFKVPVADQGDLT